MTMRMNRRFVLAAGLVALAGGAGVLAQKQPRVIKVVARRFTYTPNEIALRKGEPVTFELTTEDITMGFNVPDFGVRADIIPGRTTRLDLTPDKAGTFTFLCDIFCGDGHEGMSGTIVVT
jgi:cytochrome c oxidase subunit 2